MSDEKPTTVTGTFRPGLVDEKPLHVQVAEVLGWTRAHYRLMGGDHSCGDIMVVDTERMRWKGRAPGEVLLGPDGCNLIPRYDTDWSATGPLIEKYGLGVQAAVEPGHTGEVAHASTCIAACGEYCALPEMAGMARIKDMRMDPHRPVMGCADDITCLRAVCILIVALARAGKLPS